MVSLSCSYCGKQIKKSNGEFKKSVKRGLKNHYCNRACSGKAKIITIDETKNRLINESIKDPKTGCWNWHKSKNKKGYGHTAYNHIRSYSAHRASYKIFNGEIPESMVVRHKCDNPACVNPEHLELGTHQDNADDKVKRGRQSKGTSSGRTKLTEGDIIEMRVLYKYYLTKRKSKKCKIYSKYSTIGLSKMFQIGISTVDSIVRGESWKHVPMV